MTFFRGAGILAPAGCSTQMKKIYPVLLFLAIFIVTFFVWKGFFSLPSSAAPLSPIINKTAGFSPNPSPTPEEMFELPSRLVIPKLDLDIEVESVGMDDQGRMDVPKGVTNVGWYKLGVKPGQTGNAVFDGHFDKPDGSPSVFYKLGSLKKGDLIEVIDQKDEKKQFKVTEVRVVDLDKFPLQEVFGETNKKMLNLITCGGEWNKAKKEYSERTIVFSEMVTPERN